MTICVFRRDLTAHSDSDRSILLQDFVTVHIPLLRRGMWKNWFNDISTLSTWLKNDILSVTGPDLKVRRDLLDFVIHELRSRESQSPHRIRPVRRLLESQGEDLLRFVEDLDKSLEELADGHGISLNLIRQVFELQAISPKTNRYWKRTKSFMEK